MATFQNKVLVLGGESYTSQRADDPSFVHVLDTSELALHSLQIVGGGHQKETKRRS
jgi:hypothetical protein